MRHSSRVLLVAAVSLVSPVSWAQGPAPAGGEFMINTITTGNQFSPAVAADAAGAFVVTWWDSPPTGPSHIFARRFAATGVPAGAEFQVDAATTTRAFRPIAAADGQGRFAVVWYETTPLPASAPAGVFARIYERSGAPVSGPFLVSNGTHAVTPSVAARPGGFVATWLGYGGDIFARRFDGRGNLQGAQFVVNTNTVGFQYGPTVAARPDGGFVVAWSNGAYSYPRGIFARRYDAAAAPIGAEFKLNSATTGGQAYPVISGDAAGNFVVVWQEPFPRSLSGRLIDASGAPAGPQFVATSFALAAFYPHTVRADRAGTFTVMWEAYGDGNQRGLFARRFARDATPRDGGFRVNTYTTGFQASPGLASDGAGNLFMAWTSSHPGTTDLFGQRFGGLIPTALAVDDGGNGVLETGDSFTLRTSWRNVSGALLAFQGQSANVSAPPGLTLTLSAAADYGSVANGAVGGCAVCFSGTLSGSRPAGHVDAALVENILPVGQGQAQPWVLHVGDSFADVPRTNTFYRFVERLLHRSVTGGCGPNVYCPAGSTTREQMAVFVLVAKEGAGYQPPACGTPQFPDVPPSSPFCAWVEELARRGIVTGCGGGNYCPADPVSREQMAVFVLRTLDPALNPPACMVPMFADVPASSPFCRWIEELARRGVVTGCSPGNYCPSQPVTREQRGVFISATFGLTLYGP